MTVTAVPAQHGPDGTDHITGPVIGFVLSAPGAETVYVSGDNASLDVVRGIAERIGEGGFLTIAVLNLAQKLRGAGGVVGCARSSMAAFAPALRPNEASY